jgi:hypothetical protein
MIKVDTQLFAAFSREGKQWIRDPVLILIESYSKSGPHLEISIDSRGPLPLAGANVARTLNRYYPVVAGDWYA